MTDTAAETHVNGTAPTTAAGEPAGECASTAERGLAILAGILGLFVILVAFDMWTGGKLSGLVPVRRGDERG